MVDSADRFTCLTRCQEWLKFEGYRTDSWKQLEQVWSRDETRNPDRLPGARLVVFAGQDGVSNPAGFSSRCDGVFSELQKYFSKKHRSIGSAKSYLAFILVPLTSPNEELARFAGTFRPALSSFQAAMCRFWWTSARALCSTIAPKQGRQPVGQTNSPMKLTGCSCRQFQNTTKLTAQSQPW